MLYLALLDVTLVYTSSVHHTAHRIILRGAYTPTERLASEQLGKNHAKSRDIALFDMGPSATLPGLPNTADQPQVSPNDDLVSSLPAPIVRLLVLFARPIAWLRIAIEVLSWKAGRRVESWMVVGGWWGICLGAGHAFK